MQNSDSSAKEIPDEDVAYRTISDLDVMATYNILIDRQQQFDQRGVPAAVGCVENEMHEKMCAGRLASTAAHTRQTLMDAFIKKGNVNVLNIHSYF